MKHLGIIPARYASTRFPGKPLVEINGLTMIERVYRQAAQVIKTVYVATDDDRIADEVKRFNGNVIMTSVAHQSGTDRCFEALELIQLKETTKYDVVVNIQGDEPFIDPHQIELLIDCFNDESTDIATLIKPIDSRDILFDPNKPKVVVGKNNKAIYFSRLPIPFLRGKTEAEWHLSHPYWMHIGLYAYRSHILNEITKLKQSPLELAESLEQLRWIENGYNVSVRISNHESIGVDTPEDLTILKQKGFMK